ncbi:hypothetical protein QTI33_27540 [Variovorax sp. J22P271]|uniref:hypothetical protein n=1 Tax=Variovorax davisae TaxID=3053515 RepID=UPI002575C231|nr:hypothetical protein [Variovorax sp. J22P271]MDM0035917.1 hypothetical protein [Variovorax sp. J22P271]
MRPGSSPDTDGLQEALRAGGRVSSLLPLEHLPPTPDPRARARTELLSMALMASIVLGYAFACWGTDDPADTSALPLSLAPSTIEELHPSIASVVEEAAGNGAVLELTLVQAAPMYPASVVSEFSRDALAVARRMRQFFPHMENPTVRFVAEVAQEPGGGLLFSIDLDRARLMAKAGTPDFTFQDLLNQAQAVRFLDPEGRRYVASFCADPIASSATQFCLREVH